MLAKDLGMTVSEMMRKMSAREFDYWAVYYKTENEMRERAIKKANQ